jgi:hypothetical protein
VLDDLSQLLATEVDGGASVSVERGRNRDGVDFVRINLTGGAAAGDVQGAAAGDDDATAVDDLAASLLFDPQAVGDDESSTDEDDYEALPPATARRLEGGPPGMFVVDLTARGEQVVGGVVDFSGAAVEDGEAVIEINGRVERFPLDGDLEELLLGGERQGGASGRSSSSERGARGMAPHRARCAPGAARLGSAAPASCAALGPPAPCSLLPAPCHACSSSYSRAPLTFGPIWLFPPPVARGAGGDDGSSSSGDEGSSSLEGDTLSSMGLGFMAHRVPATLEWRSRDAFTLDVPVPEPIEAAAEAEAGVAAAVDLDIDIDIEVASGSDDGPQAVDVSATRLRRRRGGGGGGGEDDARSASAARRRRAERSERLEDLEGMVRRAMGDAIAQGIGATPAAPGDPLSELVMGLKGRVEYARLAPPAAPTDPFDGVYLGTFGPHGPELLRVARSEVGGEEWVLGTKLTGDPNVPAGKVSFRARVGRAARLPPSAAYPPEFGVGQRYKGQGRVAREGYAHAKWVDGELLTFSAGNPLTRGAELGFVYNMDSARRFLLLFTKVRLEELLPVDEGGQHEG